MRFLRRLLALGLLAAIGYTFFQVRVGRATPAGHLAAWWRRSPTVARGWAALRGLWEEPADPPARQRREPRKPAAGPSRPPPVEATPARAELLAKAAARMEAELGDGAAPKAELAARDDAPRASAPAPAVPASSAARAPAAARAPGRDTHAAPAKTRVDERLSPADKKALDELLTSRLGRD